MKGNPKQTKDIVVNKPFTGFDRKEDWYPLVRGTQINRYLTKWDGEWLAEPRKSEIFFEPKLLIRRTDDNLLCAYDKNSFIGINSVHSIQSTEPNFANKYLLAQINSKICNWFFQHENFHMVGKPLAEVKVVFVERLPIILDENQQPFIEKVDLIIELNKDLQQKKVRFINRIKANLEIGKISNKLDAFYDFDFKTFLSDLKKQKLKLSLAQQDEWEEYFNAYKSEINQLQTEIEKTDKEIDQMVYELYGLTKEEIKIVEGA